MEAILAWYSDLLTKSIVARAASLQKVEPSKNSTVRTIPINGPFRN